jgi:predicted alpha/beta-hydrolase family hydrolase
MERTRELTISLPAGTSVMARVYGAAAPSRNTTLILAHGAGAGQDSPFMVAFAAAMALRGIDTVTFNFPYVQQGRRVPDRRPILEACYQAVIETTRGDAGLARQALFIGGKSMGGRIATYVAAARDAAGAPPMVDGVILLGYPLHPPGRPLERRDAHLPDVAAPLLFVQGSRDAFGTPEELEPALAALEHRATLHVVRGGDHSFKVARAGTAGQAAIHEEIQRTIVDWITAINHPPR